MHKWPLPQTANPRGLRRFRRPVATLVVGVLAAAIVAIPALARASTATLSTDKADYSPDQTVHFSGSGFGASTTYAFPVLRPDGSIVHGDGTFTPGWDLVTSDSSGNLAYSYQLDGIQGSYEGRAYPAGWSGDWNASPVASVIFTDAVANLDQCRNGPFGTDSPCDGTDTSPYGWVNGNAGTTNSHWREDDSIPYRIRFSFTATGTHTETIEWDTTQSGQHSLDYITSYDRTWATADPCAGVTGCGSPTTFPIPTDPNVTAAGVTQQAGNFTCFNCTITGVSAYTLSGTYAGTSQTSITITFTTSVLTPVLAWGGHIASQFDWGTGNAASGISGSDYHTRTLDTDGKGGNQDRSLKSGAVPGPPTIVTQVSASSISPGDSVTDTATLTGANGVPLGTVTFFECGPTATPPDCTTGGNQVGSPVAVDSTNGTATSAAFTPGTASSNNGYYCFRAEYTPDPSVFYSIGKETNTTTECFQQVAVGVSISKNYDQASYNVGDTVTLTISVDSLGPGTAHNVVVTDQLVDPALDWQIDAVNSDAGCSIDVTDLLTCNWGDMAASTTKTVVITALVTTDGIGCFDNTAYVNTDNAGSANATDHLMIYGSNVKLVVTRDASPINVGGDGGLTFTVSDPTAPNRTDATNATLNANLRPGITWTNGDPTHCTIDGSNHLSCTWATITMGTSVSVHVTGTTSPADCPSFKTTGTVGASNEGPGALSNNTSGATINVLCPDVLIVKTSKLPSVHQPNAITYILTVKNQGLGPASNVTLTDVLPTNSGLNWSIAYDPSGFCSITAGSLGCNIGSMAPGAAYKVRISSPTTSATCGTVNNTASTAASNEPSSKLTNNSASAAITVTC